VELIESYRATFPQLWECHDLIIRVEQVTATSTGSFTESLPPTEALLSAPPPQAYRFKLFVSGVDTAATEQMLRLLYTTLEASLPNAYTLQVIDVTTHPDEAEAAQISATPTLVQISPEPTRRIVGNVLNQEHMMQLLAAR
jgi:circadian clock protein KaiB